MYRVLIVEDDEVLRLIYQKMKIWSECGFNIEAQASNGAEALKLLEKDTFDLIFTDIRMPFMDGIEFLRKLKEKENAVPVIFASSYNEFEYAREGLVLGAFDYLLKPIDEKKLSDVLLRVKKHIDAESDAKVDHVVTSLLTELGLSAEKDEFVKQIAAYCCAHYEDDLTGDDLADIHGFRKDYFGKLFKQHFGITFSDFRLRVKVAYAIELLKTGNYKAYEISDMLGFSSYQYFNKSFKAVTGTSPADYKFGTNGKK